MTRCLLPIINKPKQNRFFNMNEITKEIRHSTNILFIVDVQNDFCNTSGALSNAQTVDVVESISNMLNDVVFDRIVCTMDTHGVGYHDTVEGRHLPVEHCVKPSWGWKIEEYLYGSLYYCDNVSFLEKNGFAPRKEDLVRTLYPNGECFFGYDGVYVCGVCTDICVLNTALMLKNVLPDKEIYVIETCCAGSDPENHYAALRVMKASHINVITELPRELWVNPNGWGESDIQTAKDI